MTIEITKETEYTAGIPVCDFNVKGQYKYC